MNNYKELVEILEVLENSQKWTGNWIDQGYKKFIYVPRNKQRYTALRIPLTENNEPDVTRHWVGTVMTGQYHLITMTFVPTGKSWAQMTEWLNALVYNPELLLNE